MLGPAIISICGKMIHVILRNVSIESGWKMILVSVLLSNLFINVFILTIIPLLGCMRECVNTFTYETEISKLVHARNARTYSHMREVALGLK